MIYLGRGLQFPVALEAALKLKEISYIHAEGYPAAEMKHGPIALIDENMPVVFIAPRDHTYDKIISNMEEIKARKGRIIAVVNERDEKIDKLAETVFIVTDKQYFYLNSTLVKELAKHDAELNDMVPKNVERALREKFAA